MYIWHKQCEIMHKIQRNSSNGQFHCVVCWCTFSCVGFLNSFLGNTQIYLSYCVWGIHMQTMCKYMFNVHFVNFAQFHLPNPSLFGNAFKVTVTKSGDQHTNKCNSIICKCKKYLCSMGIKMRKIQYSKSCKHTCSRHIRRCVARACDRRICTLSDLVTIIHTIYIHTIDNTILY